jgi:DNA repair exonuclease SbcCD ATPase subunit
MEPPYTQDVADEEAAIDALYARPLHEFTPARDALVALLKQNGSRDAAARVKALGKPGITAWAVNQLHHHVPSRLEAFFAAVARLREAQRLGSAEDFRKTQAARREALQALIREAEARLKQSAHAVTPDALRRIERSLDALAASGWPEGTAPGRLTGDLEAPGFDAFAGVSVAATRPSSPAPVPGAGSDAQAAARARREALEQAEAELGEAQSSLRQAKKTAAQAAAGADQARKEQAQVQQELQRVAQRAREATERAERAAFEARQAATALSESERRVEAQKAALDRARRAP